MYRMKEVECNCGWCALECHQALQEGKASSQIVGILCMIAGFIEMWAGGVAYSISSSQDIVAGAWWAGMCVFLSGLFGLIRTFQCFKCFKMIALFLGFVAVIISFVGMIIDSIAWSTVNNVSTCVNANMQGFGEINNDTVLSAALCQLESSRTIMTTGGYANVPYECGCVSKYDLGTFPTDIFSCGQRAFFYYCEQAILEDPSFQTCVLNYPEIGEYFGKNTTGFEISAKFCALQSNITSGVNNGCMCAKSDFMSSILNGSTSVKKTCINYPLNSDVLNCEQIISFLPQAYRASTAGCIVCFLISSLYLLVIIRVSFCPGCCAFAEKSVFPGSADPGVTDEEKMIDSALKMTGIRKPPPDPHAHIMDTRTKLSKYEKKNGSPLFLAWYAEK